MIPTFIRSYEFSAAVEPFRIVAFSDTENSKKVAQAAAAADPMIGVSDKMGGSTGQMGDVIRAGLAQVRLGDTVEAGDRLTADADGKAIVCTAAAGETRNYIGIAEEPGVEDDIIDFFCAPGVLHEPA